MWSHWTLILYRRLYPIVPLPPFQSHANPLTKPKPKGTNFAKLLTWLLHCRICKNQPEQYYKLPFVIINFVCLDSWACFLFANVATLLFMDSHMACFELVSRSHPASRASDPDGLRYERGRSGTEFKFSRCSAWSTGCFTWSYSLVCVKLLSPRLSRVHHFGIELTVLIPKLTMVEWGGRRFNSQTLPILHLSSKTIMSF